MASNSRFAIAIHTVGVLAFVGGESVTSQLIAKSVNTNPVVIRRIMGNLVKSGLVEVQMGTGGGSRLSRSPEEITLGDIYLALEEGEVFDVPILDDKHECPIGRTVRPVLTEFLGEAENCMLKQLHRVTLSDVMESVAARLPSGICRGES
jgi:Rrf2 family protein